MYTVSFRTATSDKIMYRISQLDSGKSTELCVTDVNEIGESYTQQLPHSF
jgi:hypothetical protein